MRLKFLVDKFILPTSARASNGYYEDESVKARMISFVALTDVGIDQEAGYHSEVDPSAGFLQKGDLILAISNTDLRVGCLWEEPETPTCVGRNCIALRFKPEYPAMVLYMMVVAQPQKYHNAIARGSVIITINTEDVKNIRMPLEIPKKIDSYRGLVDQCQKLLVLERRKMKLMMELQRSIAWKEVKEMKFEDEVVTEGVL